MNINKSPFNDRFSFLLKIAELQSELNFTKNQLIEAKNQILSKENINSSQLNQTNVTCESLNETELNSNRLLNFIESQLHGNGG